MREIKFRAWTGIRMIDFKEVCEQKYTPWNSPSLIFMQYTGLQDKKGKEIYEGDVVKYTNITDNAKPKLTEVKWKQVAYYVGWSIGNHENHEVIGNIYENPELLPPQTE